MNLPIGYDDFGKAIREKLDFIDKTLFIKQILDDVVIQVILFLSARGFSKTFNISMLHHFLSQSVNGYPTKDLFKGLKISEFQDLCSQHQGKYPVIFLTFKDFEALDFNSAYQGLSNSMSDLYAQHAYLLESPKLSEQDKKIFRTILNKEATKNLDFSLKYLSNYLFLHYGKDCWILIDEHDAPIYSGYNKGYYKEIRSFMDTFLGSALKGNPYLERGVMTGIFSIDQVNMLSGLNNVVPYSLEKAEYNEYGEYFGCA